MAKLDSIKNENLKMAIIGMQMTSKLNYYGFFALYFDFIEDNTLPAAAGVTIKDRRLKFYYNSEMLDQYVGTYGKDIVPFIVVHECQHILLSHVTRTGDRNHQLSNIAQDMLINTAIKNDFGYSFPDFFYVDKDYDQPIKFDSKKFIAEGNKLIFEPLYNFILDESENNGGGGGEGDDDGEGEGEGNGSAGSEGDKDGKGKGKGKGKKGKLVDHHGMAEDEENGSLSESEIAQMEGLVREIHESLKARGYKSGQVIEDNFNIKKKKTLVNVFKKIFGKGLDKVGTYRKLSRRCPNLKGSIKENREINILLDTSGSLYNELSEYIGHVVGKFSTYVVQVDTDVRWHGKVETMGEWKKVQKAGGGGTILMPGVEKLIELKRGNFPLYVISDFYSDSFDLSKYKGPVTFIKTRGAIDPKFSGSKMVKVVSSERE
jgi:predicted metal-dependent peptidase